MTTVHMKNYDIDIRKTKDGKYDVYQHCTNGNMGASRRIMSGDELSLYLESKGVESDKFVKGSNVEEPPVITDVFVKSNKAGKESNRNEEFFDDLTQVCLPRSSRKDPSDEDFNRRLSNIFLPKAYRNAG